MYIKKDYLSKFKILYGHLGIFKKVIVPEFWH